jgi:hypothetical protein
MRNGEHIQSSPNLAFKELQSLKAAYDVKIALKKISPQLGTGSFGPYQEN